MTERQVQQRAIASRSRILDAAVNALVEHGYSGATTVRIQQMAGVTRGRLLHHYPSRDVLLVAAVLHLTEVQMAAVTTRRRWPAELPKRLSAAIDAMWDSFHQPYFWAAMELWLAARHHDDLREALLPTERRLWVMARGTIDGFFGPELNTRPGYAVLRDHLYTSMRGVALTYAIDHRDHRRERQLEPWNALARGVLLDPN